MLQLFTGFPEFAEFVTAASQAPCAVNQATLDTSFRQKCLRLRCHDFSALAD